MLFPWTITTLNPPPPPPPGYHYHYHQFAAADVASTGGGGLALSSSIWSYTPPVLPNLVAPSLPPPPSSPPPPPPPPVPAQVSIMMMAPVALPQPGELPPSIAMAAAGGGAEYLRLLIARHQYRQQLYQQQRMSSGTEALTGVPIYATAAKELPPPPPHNHHHHHHNTGYWQPADRHASGDSSTSSSAASMSSVASTSSSGITDWASSADSGRATGGLASSLSPAAPLLAAGAGTGNTAISATTLITTSPQLPPSPTSVVPIYEFEVPNSLVGLIIGIDGKTIKELTIRTDVRMMIREHHTASKTSTHQICQVTGKRENINRCLSMLRHRFPPERFPDLNLQPVLPPLPPTGLFDPFAAQPSWLTLPEGVPFEGSVCCALNPGHLFLQQPTHATYSKLQFLDAYMLRLYAQTSGIPELPRPTDPCLLCAAPVLSAWFRAVTLQYDAATDQVLVRFVDHGGYAQLNRSALRQIRTDLMTLPFQSAECYLAHVQPVDGTNQWSQAAVERFRELVQGKVLTATVLGHHVDDRLPFVELHTTDDDGRAIRVDRVLLDDGLARAWDPSRMHRLGVKPAASALQRPLFSTQTSIASQG